MSRCLDDFSFRFTAFTSFPFLTAYGTGSFPRDFPFAEFMLVKQST
jgi:hypothetical protein